MDTAGHKVAIVIPCYKVRQHIEDVIAEIPDWVAGIYVVDDSCPEKTGAFVSNTFGTESRLSVLYHDKNQGVGAAVVTGMRAAIKDGGTIIVKMDGDGQMDPALLPLLFNRSWTMKRITPKATGFSGLKGSSRCLFSGSLVTPLFLFWPSFPPDTGTFSTQQMDMLRLMRVWPENC